MLTQNLLARDRLWSDFSCLFVKKKNALSVFISFQKTKNKGWEMRCMAAVLH